MSKLFLNEMEKWNIILINNVMKIWYFEILKIDKCLFRLIKILDLNKSMEK